MMRVRLENLSKDDAEKSAKTHLMGSGIDDIRTVSFSYDETTGEERIVGDGSADVNWYRPDHVLERRHIPIGSALGDEEASYERTPPKPKKASGTAPAKPAPKDWPGKDAPFSVAYPSYSRAVTTMTLPRGGAGFTLVGANVDETVAGVRYHRSAKLQNGVLTVETTTRAMAPEFPASEGPAAEKALIRLSDADFYVKAPTDWQDGSAEYALRAARKPVTALEFLDHADASFLSGAFDRAMADYDEALKLEPDMTRILNERCFTRAQANKMLDQALADCDKALEHDSKAANYLDSRALVYFRMGRFDDAIRDYDEAIKQSPQLASSLYMRGIAKRRRGKTTEGDADIKAALAISPTVAFRYDRDGIKP
jgi:uncharacterized protein YozE (UPF0346 family)